LFRNTSRVQALKNGSHNKKRFSLGSSAPCTDNQPLGGFGRFPGEELGTTTQRENVFPHKIEKKSN